MCHFIWPNSVKSYLSGICTELESLWPNIHKIWKSCLVLRTLTGCMKLHSMAAHHKHALTQDDLLKVLSSIPANPTHDDLLFAVIIFTGWHCLMQLGKLVNPDAFNLRDYHKTITRHSVSIKSSPHTHISFTLPMHKVDHFFKGSTIVLASSTHCLSSRIISHLTICSSTLFLNYGLSPMDKSHPGPGLLAG